MTAIPRARTRQSLPAPGRSLAILVAALCASGPSGPAAARAEEHFCGGAGASRAEVDPPRLRQAGPLDIQVQYDAVLEGTVTEPFNIVAGVNDQMRFQINGVGPFTVTLAPGTNLDATEIASRINADPVFRPVGDARENDRFGSDPGEGSVMLRSQGWAVGIFQLLSVSNDAYTTLGLTQFENVVVSPSATNSQRIVIDQAAADWEALIQDAGTSTNPYVMRVAFFGFDPDSAPIASAWVDTTSSGDLASGTARFDTGTNWYVDPAPDDDVEFDEDLGNGPPGADLLSVARHEFGHALGFSSGNARFFQYRSADSATFDASRINVALNPGTPHTSATFHPNDLMNASIGSSRRRNISIYPAASVLSRIAEYTIPQACVDAAAILAADGSVTRPWPLISGANANEPDGTPGRLIPGNHDVGLGVLLDRPGVWTAARGGAAVVGAP